MKYVLHEDIRIYERRNARMLEKIKHRDIERFILLEDNEQNM